MITSKCFGEKINFVIIFYQFEKNIYRKIKKCPNYSYYSINT